MRYAKIVDNIVVQIQPNKESGFIEVDDSVCCGMIEANGNFSLPEKTKAELKQELEDYYNSDTFRTVNVNGFDIPNRKYIRDLAEEGVVAYADKVNNGSIDRDEELPIAWKINGEKISLTYSFLCAVSEDLTRMINALYIKKDDLLDELDLSTDDSYISNWLENSKAELDNYKATL